MIPKNEKKLTDKKVAKLMAKQLYYPTSKTNFIDENTAFAFQLFIEKLVIPEETDSYDDVELEKYILKFMKNTDEIHKRIK